VQRLTQTSSNAAHRLAISERQVVGAYDQLASIIRDRLGRRHANVLAAPHIEPAGEVTWSTALDGPVVREDELTGIARETLQQQAGSLLEDIRRLAASLYSEGRAATQIVAQMLDYATRTPSGHWLYSVGGEPVLAMWGHADGPLPLPFVKAPEAASPIPPSTGAATASLAARTAPLASEEAVAAASAAASGEKRRKLLVLLLLLALLAIALAGAAFHFLRGKAPEPAPIAEPKPPVAPIAKAPEPAPPPRPEEAKPAEPPPPPPEQAKAPEPPPPPPPPPNPLDKLKERIAAAGTNCAKLKGMLSGEPLLKKSDPESRELKNQVVGTLKKNCSDTLIAEAKNMCPGERPPELAPELVIVFDASGSMKYSLLATEQEIQQAAVTEAMLGALRAFGANLPGQNANLQRLLREPTRITTARQATVAIAKKIPRDANVGLVLIEDCPQARRVGFFPPGQHGALISQLQAIQPKAGTPLADAVAKAGQMVDGVKREAVMLVVSDGQESCERENPCAVANALARAKPHLKINVVDITGTGAGNCLASATHGKVFPANRPEEIALGADKAAADVMTPSRCTR
jgi:Mg-chelatase subunit ChlD